MRSRAGPLTWTRPPESHPATQRRAPLLFRTVTPHTLLRLATSLVVWGACVSKAFVASHVLGEPSAKRVPGSPQTWVLPWCCSSLWLAGRLLTL